MRRQIIAGNWKMHKTPGEAEAFIHELAPLVAGAGCDVIVAPPFPCLERAARALNGTHIGLAAQNLFWEPKGAFTGEVAANMLIELGVQYVIIGHSERRQFFGENDDKVNKRARAALESGLIPIFCVGESLQVREANRTREVVGRQIRRGLRDFTAEQVAKMVIAYEPVWAIGTGRVATTEQALQMHAGIRKLLGNLFDEQTASAVRIQYGGSVKPDNAAALLSHPDIDGALVGGASLVAKDFAAICNTATGYQ